MQLKTSPDWRTVWEDNSRQNDLTDFQLDRGVSPRDEETEALAEREEISFIEPHADEKVLDAGCGTGVNILRLYSRVKSIVGFDYALASLTRCHNRIQDRGVRNAHVHLASITAIPLPDRSVNRVLCLSVLQYLDDDEVRRALRECLRVLVPSGTIVLHVKNSSSLYWSTLGIAKKLKRLLGRSTQLYNLRSFAWYEKELRVLGFRIVDYRSFNILMLHGIPMSVTRGLQKIELKFRDRLPFRLSPVRRHGADLKIKAIADPAFRKQAGTIH